MPTRVKVVLEGKTVNLAQFRTLATRYRVGCASPMSGVSVKVEEKNLEDIHKRRHCYIVEANRISKPSERRSRS